MFPWLFYPIVFSLLGLNVVSIYLLPTREYCRPFQCIENGLNLTYPFWPLTDLNRTVKTYCGYHGYGVNCSDGKPIITVSDHKYWVKTVNYSSSTFTAVDMELMDLTCGSGRNYSLNSWTSTRRDFYFGFETEFITLHRNCSSSPTSPPASSVLCQDSNPEKVSYFVSEDTDTDNRKFICEENLEIPVLSDMATNLSNFSLPSVWQRGFQLSWSQYPVTECVSCRIAGGRCGYVESYYSYICFCPSGTISFRQDCDADNRGDRKKVYVIVSVTLVASIIVGALAWILYRTKEKRSGKKKKILEMFTSDKTSVDRREFPLLLEDQARAREGQELPLFEFNVIEIATNKFTNKLGEGGFGPVYKGKLVNGQEIAVKRLSRSSGQGIEEFKNELKLISKLQHRNLVRLLGFCIEKEEKMLVYEYMPYRSLDAFIFDPIRKSVLDWGKRFNIVDGIARGLLYLHRDSRLRIIHRDLKASNILLDEDMNPKISDFGMARMFGGNQISASTNRVVGTYGYMSPEYAMEGLFSEKSDVFSFGVLLLEILSSERNTSFYRSEESLNLLGYAWRLWNEGKAIEFIDPTLVDPYLASELTRCIHVGLLCVQERAIDRPTMSAIVFMLGSDAILPTPKQPAFILDKQLHSDMAQILGSVSLNSITLTSVGGR